MSWSGMNVTVWGSSTSIVQVVSAVGATEIAPEWSWPFKSSGVESPLTVNFTAVACSGADHAVPVQRER